MLGGGSLPTQKISTWCVAIEPKSGSVNNFSSLLRKATPSVIGRVQKDRLFLDMRTVQPSQDAELVSIFETLGSQPEEAAKPV